MAEKVLVTAREAAEMLSIGESEVRGLVANGHLERRYIGSGRRMYRIPVSSIVAYAESLPQDPVGEAS